VRGRETAAVRKGKSERAKRIRNLWNDGKFDLKIVDCRERRTSSCAVLFSSGRAYRLYAVRIIEPCLCDFRKQIYKRYESLVRTVILGVVRDQSDVDDVLTEVLMQI